MKKSIYILYHGNCYDGFGAAFAAWLRFRNDAEYIPVSYGKPFPADALGADEVYIVDFSYPRDVLADVAKQVGKLVVLDHHHTAQQDLAGLKLPGESRVVFDMNKSGAVLAWEHFHNYEGAKVPEFIQYLQDRDLWKFELPQSREVAMALRSYPMDFETWSQITGLVTQGQIYELPGSLVDNLKKEGIACKRLTDQQVDIMAKHHRWAVFTQNPPHVQFWDVEPTSNGHCWIGPVANATAFFSEVGERMLELNPQSSFSAYYLDRNDGKRQWGLRSRPDFDCSIIAKAFGGGGHKQASGFVQEL